MNQWPNYRTIWRWHFYAGVFCIPFVLVLAITGTIYLFRPQIESWQERSYDRLSVQSDSEATLTQQIESAVASIPNGKFAAVERPTPVDQDNRYVSATRVLVDQDGQRIRVYVNPQDASVLGSVIEEQRFIRIVRRIHGELLLGKRGSYLVELVASWTIVMIVTGLVLWMPRRVQAAGVIYPRLTSTGKTFWKDIHSVGGFYLSGLIVFLILTGLPWSLFWGDYFKSARQWTGTAASTSHWDNGSSQRKSESTGHEHHAVEPTATMTRSSGPSWRQPVPDPNTYDLNEVEKVMAVARTFDWLPPVSVSPPVNGDSNWTIKSETANRPYQQSLRFNAVQHTQLDHETFTDRHWVDRWVGQGIALHEGQRFGWPNQLIALATTSGLITLAGTGIGLWWRRRDSFGLSPPKAIRTHGMHRSRPSIGRLSFLTVLVLALAVLLPLFGASLMLILGLDWLIFLRLKPLKRWLGREVPAT